MTIEIDRGRFTSELAELAEFSEQAPPVVTRIVYSEEDLAARRYLKGLFAEAGLDVREDAVGNTFARWAGTDPTAPAVATGSHADAIPNAGMYDGTVGVLGGLEAIRALKRAGYKPRRPIELILFTSEEPTRFGIGCLGSRLMSGALTPEKAADLRDADGRSLDEVRGQAGFGGSLESVRIPEGRYHAFVELHIEQGPLLEQKGIDIGLVTAIAAPASGTITVHGEGGHAGAVLMADRKDALVAAAEVIQAVALTAMKVGSPDTVATVGKCDVFPGAVNSIPSRVILSIDVRDIDLAPRDRVISVLRNACPRLVSLRGASVEFDLQTADAPATCYPEILESAERACASAGATSMQMVSRAYHDALFMSRIAPTGMLFIPCRGGVSHRPDEFSTAEQIAKGVLVLANTLSDLAK